MTLVASHLPQNFPASVGPKQRHHQWMPLLEVARQGMQIARENYLSVMLVIWRLNGLNRMSQEFTSPSEPCQGAKESSDESDSGESFRCKFYDNI